MVIVHAPTQIYRSQWRAESYAAMYLCKGKPFCHTIHEDELPRIETLSSCFMHTAAHETLEIAFESVNLQECCVRYSQMSHRFVCDRKGLGKKASVLTR